MKHQVEPNHYFSRLYDTKERFISYWNQINILTNLEPTSILEIGIGHSFVLDYLDKKGYTVTSLDIDSHLNPDAAGSVTNIPFLNASFDVVACFEVLEHLPYNQFCLSLEELYRVSKKYVALSIPDATHAYQFYFQMPANHEFKKLIQMPMLRSLKHEFDGQHYWEIGKAIYPLKRITKDIEESGFIIQKTFRVFEVPYHRFFLLKKVSNKS